MMFRPFFSEHAVIMALLSFSIFAVCSFCLSRKAGWNILGPIGFGTILSILRCFLPFEVPGNKIIHMGGILTRLYWWLLMPVWGEITPAVLLLAVWLLGTLLSGIVLCVRICRQCQIAKSAEWIASSDLQQIYQSVVEELQCGKSGTLVALPNYTTALMIGFFRPNVILPVSYQTMTEDELRMILRHELAHYKSKDLWIKLLLEDLCCLLWWNPAAYLLRSGVGQLIELRCDSIVCRDFDENQCVAYSKVMINAIKTSSVTTPYIAAGYLGHGNREKLVQRFQQILSASKKQRAVWPSIVIILLAVILFCSSYSIVFLPETQPPADDPSLEIGIDIENSFILAYPDGTFEVYINGQMYGTLNAEQLEQEPYTSMSIFEANITQVKDVNVP